MGYQLFLYIFLIHLFRSINSPEIPEDHHEIEEKIINVNQDEDIIINFENSWNVSKVEKLFINMKLESSSIFTLARIEKQEIKIFTSPFILYIKNLTTEFVEFRTIPIHFDNAEIYILGRYPSKDRQYIFNITERYRLKVTGIFLCIKISQPQYHL
ncbi:hypothetical protein HZS_6522 [Henneguya salminicola]|nr:hypothetical protein HZS_6522 [Henneguya salminicola]